MLLLPLLAWMRVAAAGRLQSMSAAAAAAAVVMLVASVSHADAWSMCLPGAAPGGVPVAAADDAASRGYFGDTNGTLFEVDLGTGAPLGSVHVNNSFYYAFFSAGFVFVGTGESVLLRFSTSPLAWSGTLDLTSVIPADWMGGFSLKSPSLVYLTGHYGVVAVDPSSMTLLGPPIAMTPGWDVLCGAPLLAAGGGAVFGTSLGNHTSGAALIVSIDAALQPQQRALRLEFPWPFAVFSFSAAPDVVVVASSLAMATVNITTMKEIMVLPLSDVLSERSCARMVDGSLCVRCDSSSLAPTPSLHV